MFAGKIHESSNDCPTYRADRLGTEILCKKTNAERKAAGLYFTPTEVAFFMADQIIGGRSSLRILEPAAGSGTLLCAAVEHLTLTGKLLREVEITAYETDPDLQIALEASLDYLKRWASRRGIRVHATVEKRDFILAQDQILGTTQQLFHSAEAESFDVVIANPPYFKISKCDPRAQGATSVVRGQPNIYAIFMAAGAALLRHGGELLFITPRSFASGPYFRLFRERFFASVRPQNIHVFGSRRDAFSRDEVLQENIILKGVRDDGWQSRKDGFELLITSSAGLSDLDRPSRRTLAIEQALGKAGTDMVLRLPIVKDDDDAARVVDSWTGSLHRYGLNISTGPVVPFRATEFLVEAKEAAVGLVPLVWMNHVHAMRVSFPNGTRKPQYIRESAGERSLLLPNRNYVLLRRFSSKEEGRRLVAAPWFRSASPCSLVGIENHLNYIHRPGAELDEDEALGLAALLNSKLLDTYFRVSSGNTQVSATELRAMPLPSFDKILSIGRCARTSVGNLQRLEEIVEQAVGASR